MQGGGDQELNLPAGDEDIISAAAAIDAPIIAEIDLYKLDPWQLPDRKYPSGTGADKAKTLGIKKALVFYAGKAPNGIKTNWIMHEYRLANVDRSAGKRNDLRLDDWVLCRIYNKKGTLDNKHYYNVDHDHEEAGQFSDSEEQKPNVSAFPYNSCAGAGTTDDK